VLSWLRFSAWGHADLAFDSTPYASSPLSLPTLSFALALNRYGDTMYKQACARGPTVLHCYFTAAEGRTCTGPSDLLFQRGSETRGALSGLPALGMALSKSVFLCVVWGANG
jgi:hypothetical protein